MAVRRKITLGSNRWRKERRDVGKKRGPNKKKRGRQIDRGGKNLQKSTLKNCGKKKSPEMSDILSWKPPPGPPQAIDVSV